MKLITTALILTLAGSLGTACSGGGAATNTNAANTQAQNTASEPAKPTATPSNKITDADVAKLKWMEGTWRGTGADKPFYQKIRFEGSTLVIDSFTDESLSKVQDTSAFELEDGEFGRTVGEQRSAAASITENAANFVPDTVTLMDGRESPTPKGSTFSFERQGDGTWTVRYEAPKTKKDPGGEKVYKMEPWKATAAAARPANANTNASK